MLGPFEYKDQKLTYKGQYYNGLRDGIGEQVWKDGSCYKGFFRDDRSDGKGLQVYANGDWYKGDWREGMSHGIGTYFQSLEGITYDGEWIKGEQNGFGKETYPDGSYYEGKKSPIIFLLCLL